MTECHDSSITDDLDDIMLRSLHHLCPSQCFWKMPKKIWRSWAMPAFSIHPSLLWSPSVLYEAILALSSALVVWFFVCNGDCHFCRTLPDEVYLEKTCTVSDDIWTTTPDSLSLMGSLISQNVLMASLTALVKHSNLIRSGTANCFDQHHMLSLRPRVHGFIISSVFSASSQALSLYPSHTEACRCTSLFCFRDNIENRVYTCIARSTWPCHACQLSTQEALTTKGDALAVSSPRDVCQSLDG